MGKYHCDFIVTKPALVALKDYEKQKKEGKDPVFDPGPLGIKMLISGSMNTEKVRKKKYLNGIEMKKQRKIPLLFMSKMKQAVIFAYFEYKRMYMLC